VRLFAFSDNMSLRDGPISRGHTWTQTLLKNVHMSLIIVITRDMGKLVFKTGILFVVSPCRTRVTSYKNTAIAEKETYYVFWLLLILFNWLTHSDPIPRIRELQSRNGIITRTMANVTKWSERECVSGTIKNNCYSRKSAANITSMRFAMSRIARETNASKVHNLIHYIFFMYRIAVLQNDNLCSSNFCQGLLQN